MNNRSREVLAVALSLSMIFNTANAKVRKEVYLPVEPLTVEEPVMRKGKLKSGKGLKMVKKNM